RFPGADRARRPRAASSGAGSARALPRGRGFRARTRPRRIRPCADITPSATRRVGECAIPSVPVGMPPVHPFDARKNCPTPKDPEMPAIPVFVRMFAFWLLFATALAACAAAPPRPAAAGDGYVEYAIGDASMPTPGQVRPGLMLVGGGD